MEKIKQIVSKMTFEQKALLLTGYQNKTTEYPELGVPSVTVMDGPNGVRRSKYDTEGGCVCMPTASAVGASWNREIAYKAGQTIAYDCIREDVDILLAPGVNMKRTPHGGRNFEYYSEDPVLSGELAAAFINGLESEGIGASLKHFALNNQELDRFFINAEVDERTLREYYLKVFQIVLENSNPATVMCSYNKAGGIWAAENKYLLTDILKEEWKYEGMIISDWRAVHDIGKSIKAGLDLQMPNNPNIVEQLQKSLDDGIVTMDDIDRAVTSMLKFVFKTKEKPRNISKPHNRQKQHEIAQELANECITLLRNEKEILPITGKKYKKIGVYGRNAQTPVITGSGSSRMNIVAPYLDIPIDFIHKYAAEQEISVDFEVLNSDGYMGAEMVGKLNKMEKNDLDAIVVFIGDNYGADTESEHWDRDNITFPNYMNGIIDSACNACDNVVVVMNTGSATIPARWGKMVRGVIQMWYPGEGGGKAIADILFGKVNPSSKLSETFILKERNDVDYSGDGYKTWYKEGMFVGYRYYDKNQTDVWFPFGHGLSYTNFEYSDIKLSKKFCDNPDDEITVEFNVKNIGNIAGKEIVQLYINHENPIVLKPQKELKKFDKIFLQPNESKTICFTIGKKDLQYYNIYLRDWHVESGKYNILVGASSVDIRLKEEYVLTYNTDYTIGKRKAELEMA